MTRAARLYCLHGFLGLPADWSEVFAPRTDFAALDLLALGAREEKLSLAAIADKVKSLALIERDACKDAVPGSGASRLSADARALIGYSMGGRIAMEALVGGEWDAAVIIAAHPGLTSERERDARASEDAREAEPFANEPWPQVTEKWLAKSVFAGRRPVSPRVESAFDRAALVWAMREWSLGKQPDLRPALAALEIPVLFLAGSEDPKYAALARECASLNPRFEYGVLDGAAHRVPWEAPAAFRASVDRFLGNHSLRMESQ